MPTERKILGISLDNFTKNVAGLRMKGTVPHKILNKSEITAKQMCRELGSFHTFPFA